MEIIIQTKKNFWHINSTGIRKVKTFDWQKAMDTINILFLEQNKKFKEFNKNKSKQQQSYIKEESSKFKSEFV